MSLIDALDEAFDHTAAVFEQVNAADRWSASTPCAPWTVEDLTGHCHGVVAAFAEALERGPGVVADERPRRVTADEFRRAAAATMAGWRAEGVLDREVDGLVILGTNPVPPIPLPGRSIAAINLLDTATHAWDLAVAVGAPAELPDGVLGELDAAAAAILTPGIREYIGFAEAVPAAPDASPTDRLMAFLGRSGG